MEKNFSKGRYVSVLLQSSLQANVSIMSDDPKSIQLIPIEKLSFDPQNPRLPSTINGDDEQAVLDWMLRDATIIELMGSIGEQGYFPGEPLLVVPKASKEGTYTVVEGNRRLTAVKLLRHPAMAPIRKQSVQKVSAEARYRPDQLPVLVYDKREEILNYLSYRHITGIKAWDSLAKAKYLGQLRENLPEQPVAQQFTLLAKTIGSRADYVARLLTGLAVYNKIVERDFFDIEGLNDATVAFSLLTTALTYTNILTFLGLKGKDDPSVQSLNVSHLRELTSWIYQRDSQGRTRLGESRNLEELSRIVEKPEALEAFRSGAPIKDAIILTEVPEEIFRNAVLDAKGRLQIARDYIHRVPKPAPTDADNLQDIQSMARDLRIVVNSKLDEANQDRI